LNIRISHDEFKVFHQKSYLSPATDGDPDYKLAVLKMLGYIVQEQLEQLQNISNNSSQCIKSILCGHMDSKAVIPYLLIDFSGILNNLQCILT